MRPLLLLSPAKTLNFESALTPFIAALSATEPRFLSRANDLSNLLAAMPKAQLKSLMSLSDSLAALNHARYSAFAEQEARIAIGAFEGAAYKGMDAPTLKADDLEYLCASLRILCGQYGVLVPTDEIRPYRLEMSTRLAVGENPNLYKYWSDDITASLCSEVLDPERKVTFVLNVASQEYAKAVDLKRLAQAGAQVITAVFPGPAVHAKTARGEMVRFCAQRRVTKPGELTAFTGTRGEWAFVPSASSESELVFHRSAAGKGKGKGKADDEEDEDESQPSKPSKRARNK
jgi:cytoplasmic iron level regulating protein YaaA (DUF328/UPF0246 family)